MPTQKNKKLAVVISSFSCVLIKELDQYSDIYLTPLQIFIDSEQWYEGFYDKEEKYSIVEKFKKSNNFKTSLAPISIVEEQMKELSEKYDDVIYLPINSYLSSSHDSILNISKNFHNVHVFDNHFSGYVFLDIALEIKKQYENENRAIEEIFKFLNWYNDLTIGYIIPLELDTFIKSGRLKGIKKKIMTSLNLSTIIEVTASVDSVGISRTKKIAANKVVEKLEHFIKKHKLKIDDFEFTIIYAYDMTITNIFKEALLKNGNLKPDHVYESSIITMLHTGYGAGYIGINPKIKNYRY